VVVGLVLTRYFMFIADRLQEPKAIKLYYPYLAFLLANILQLYWAWFRGKQDYIGLEWSESTLLFYFRLFIDGVACIAPLILIPQDKFLGEFFDMKSWFMKVKRAFAFTHLLYFLAVIMAIVLRYFFTDDVQAGLGAVLLSDPKVPVVMLLYVGTAFSKNVYYLSFHGTFMVAFFSIYTSGF